MTTSLRADAERNRSAVLCAAAAAFRDSGLGVPLEDVARRAGVGIATLYRRFPSRESLIEAVFDAQMAAYADRAEAAAERSLAEPWPAFEGHVRNLVKTQIEDAGFGAALLQPMQGSCLFARDHARAVSATVLLVDRVRTAGAARPDLHHSDIYVLLAAVSALVAEPGPLEGAQAAARLTDLVLGSLGKDRP